MKTMNFNERKKECRENAKKKSRVFNESRYHDENQQKNTR